MKHKTKLNRKRFHDETVNSIYACIILRHRKEKNQETFTTQSLFPFHISFSCFAKRLRRKKISPQHIGIQFNTILILINPKSESTAQRRTHNSHGSWEKWKCVVGTRIYIENNNGWAQERKIKHKTESDMKISFRCFFDRTRCVREIRMAKLSFFSVHLAVHVKATFECISKWNFE